MNGWAHSPYDLRSHLLAALESDPPGRELEARCGHQLPAVAVVSPVPISTRCQACELYSWADDFEPGRFTRP